jgi:hypothetical protein
VRNLFSLSLLVFLFIPFNAWSLPIDWNGVFGVDTTLIDNFRRLEQRSDATSGNLGSQEIPYAAGNQANASFQSYIFRLQPSIIVNDATTLKGEISTNYARGGRFGDSSKRAEDKEASFGGMLYTHNTTTNSSLNINQLYAELYSDAATWQIGRHSFGWGLGVLYDEGNDVWDRFASSRDGITAKIKIGNFQLTPYWAKIEQENFTRASRVREYGAGVIYDNIERDLAFGLLYGIKNSGSQATKPSVDTNGDNTATAMGNADIKITDIYFAKKFGDLSFAVEVPILSGELGDFFENGSVIKYKSKAYILESEYALSDKWKINLMAGKVSGQAAGSNNFEAMYLHPNYQVAELMFRYDLRAVSNGNQIYDSYINNATYAKIAASYTSGKWTWDTAFIWAKADQVAEAGKQSYNHDTGKIFIAQTTQADDLGMEIDLGFDYQWNKEVHIGFGAGYLMTGDYFAYTNDPAQKNEASNTFVLQLRTAIEF